ncbi:MAG: hypothetical protein ACQERT_04485, partial [Thermodesulfobacteriota bacterium]
IRNTLTFVQSGLWLDRCSVSPLAAAAQFDQERNFELPPPSFRYWIGVQHRLQPESRIKI